MAPASELEVDYLIAAGIAIRGHITGDSEKVSWRFGLIHLRELPIEWLMIT